MKPDDLIEAAPSYQPPRVPSARSAFVFSALQAICFVSVLWFVIAASVHGHLRALGGPIVPFVLGLASSVAGCAAGHRRAFLGWLLAFAGAFVVALVVAMLAGASH
jgi:hypothetical protein